MAKRRKKKKKQSQQPNQATVPKATSPAASLEETRDEVARMLALGRSKAAVDAAKLAHKDHASRESEIFLGETYAARIKSMIEKGMPKEAQALLEMAQQRYPAAASAFEGLAFSVKANSGDVNELLSPLAQPDLSADLKQQIEETIRHTFTDLQALAENSVLPPDHPLSTAARAAWTAFVAVSSGPVDEAALALPEISRRSPLASWKNLIRAMGCFYRREDARCRQYLNAIDPASPPARFLPVLEDMMNRVEDGAEKAAQKRLAKEVLGEGRGLRKILREVDDRLEHLALLEKPTTVIKSFDKMLHATKKLDAALAKRIRRHVWVKAFIRGMPIEIIDELIKPQVLRDASFWALLAQSSAKPDLGSDFDPFMACAAWDSFITHGLHEGLFKAKSHEVGHLYGVMIEAQESICSWERPNYLEDFYELYPSKRELYRGQPVSISKGASPCDADEPQSLYYLDVEKIHRRRTKADPTPEAYRSWLQYSQARNIAKHNDKIALSWAKAFPQDPEPLLKLMESAEKRYAFSKALNYLEKAEQRDALNPEVRRARFRLLLAIFKRHLKQKKFSLAAKDLDALEALPPLDGEDRRAVYAALRISLAIVQKKSGKTDPHEKVAAELLNDPLTAKVLAWAIAEHLGVDSKALPRIPKASQKLDKGLRAAAVARASLLARDAEIVIAMPYGWDTRLRIDLRDHTGHIAPKQLEALSEALFEAGNWDLAYYATHAALLQEGDHLARFFVLRERCIPENMTWRRQQCLLAAMHLAREVSDFKVLDEAVDRLKSDNSLRQITDHSARHAIDPEHFTQTLAYERKEKKAPDQSLAHRKWAKQYYPKCKCPQCREARAVAREADPFRRRKGEEYDTESFDLKDYLDDWNPCGESLPKDLEKELLALIKRLKKSRTPEIEIRMRLLAFMMKYRGQQKDNSFFSEDVDAGEQTDLFDELPF